MLTLNGQHILAAAAAPADSVCWGPSEPPSAAQAHQPGSTSNINTKFQSSSCIPSSSKPPQDLASTWQLAVAVGGGGEGRQCLPCAAATSGQPLLQLFSYSPHTDAHAMCQSAAAAPTLKHTQGAPYGRIPQPARNTIHSGCVYCHTWQLHTHSHTPSSHSPETAARRPVRPPRVKASTPVVKVRGC